VQIEGENVDAVSCLGRADHRHARLRAFISVFRTPAIFFPVAAAGFLFFAKTVFLALAPIVFLALTTASIGAGKSGLGDFGL